MQEASHVRRAVREAIGDVEPDRLRDDIMQAIESSSTAPGVLTVLSARTAIEDRAGTSPRLDGELEPAATDAVADRAAGVQLIYEGLGLTRALAHEEPWADGGRDREDADIAILAADVLVARGFYVLARTEAARKAVETVQRFGRDQTERREASAPEELDHSFEADVFELAAIAGTTIAGGDAPDALVGFVGDFARSFDGSLPPAEEAFDASIEESIVERTCGRGHERGSIGGEMPSTTDS